MESTGLLSKYSVGRTLTEDERKLRLGRSTRRDLPPVYQLSVIRLNSTYMELVDKFFPLKGLISTVAIVSLFISLYGLLGLVFDFMDYPTVEAGDWLLLFGVALVFSPVLWTSAFFLRKDCCTYTHYPIRLNRKTRMVHVFRLNGTVLTVPWDEVFFCIAALPQGDWEIQGHVLDADGVTVKETFPLSYYTPTSGLPVLERYWEFVRRYMEEGPEDAAHRVEFFMPVADRRESIANGFHRMHAELGGNFIMTVIGAALALMLVPGRWIAMQTSKVPRWPREIEEACRIEPGDPWIRDATTVTPSAN